MYPTNHPRNLTLKASRSLIRYGFLALLIVGSPCLAERAGSTPTGLPAPTPAPLGPLTFTAEQRARYETLDGQFRAGRRGGDQAIAFRTLIKAEADFDPVRFLTELMDSRQVLADTGSALNTGTVDSFALLQAHLAWDMSPDSRLRIGRMTQNLGGRRLVARNAYRNTINTFTGMDWLWQPDDGPFTLHAFYLLPVRRLPGDLPSLRDNDIQFDQEDFRQQFWGLRALMNERPFNSRLELYTYGLHEDPSWRRGRGRKLFTHGFRLNRAPAKGRFDFDLESALQWGQSRLAAAGPRLEHLAWFGHASVGYTFDAPWKPRLRLAYDHASGDANPSDGRNQRFDTLFGARRFEYGPTGLYGAIARSNLHSPEVRLTLKPHAKVDFRLAHRGVWLASSKDAWTSSGVQDVSGASGHHVGQQVEASLRWKVIPDRFELETGLAHFFAGSFLDRAPNATGQGDTSYGYFQTTLRF